MKTETSKTDKCRVELKVTLDAGETTKVVREVERAFVREVRMPGFRPGKVPLDMIRRNYADDIKRETISALCKNNLDEAIKASGLDVVGVAEVKDVAYDENGGSFTASVDVKPTFKLPKYKGLSIVKNDVTVPEAEVADATERMRAAYAKFEDAKEGDAVADGDFVQIDYSGEVDGKPIAEIAPEAKVVASAQGFWVQIEEGRFVPEILDALKGMKAGETKEGVEVAFPEESAPKGLEGAKASYKVTLKAFRRRIMPTDEEFAKACGEESVEKVSASLRERMQKRADEAEAARREDEAVKALLADCDFDLPETVVSRTKDSYIRQYAERAQQSGIPAEYFEKNRDKIQADAQEAAERQVRLWYVLEAIAEAEGIEDGDERGKKAIDLVLANAKA